MPSNSTAVLSPCGRYRYRLTREVDPVSGRGRVLFVMLNPSTADATVDDPTIRKCVGFARRAYAPPALIDVVNLYAWRATDPNDLRRAADASDVIGPETDMHIGEAADRAGAIVVAWGALNLGAMSAPARERARDVARRLRLAASGAPLLCLGTTKGGEPRHPLMVAYSVVPSTWSDRDA